MGKFANLNKQDEFVFVHIGNTLFPLKIFKNNFQEKEIREIKLHRFWFAGNLNWKENNLKKVKQAQLWSKRAVFDPHPNGQWLPKLSLNSLSQVQLKHEVTVNKLSTWE